MDKDAQERRAKLKEALREEFPHGHPEFVGITFSEMQLHSDKNHDYAAGGKPTGNFDRVATILSLYPGLKLSDPKVVALCYMLKQLDAVLWGLSAGIKQKVEGIKERLGDISIYSKIVMGIATDEAEAQEEWDKPRPAPRPLINDYAHPDAFGGSDY